MRVLHVISGIEPENGGPTAVVCGILRALRSAGVVADLLATWKSESALANAESLRQDGIAVTLVGPAKPPLMRHQGVKTELAQLVPEYQLVHIHAVWEDVQYQAAKAAHASDVPYIWTPHGMLDKWSLSQRRLLKSAFLGLRLKKWLRRASALQATSDFERRQIAELGLHRDIVTEGFGVDPAILAAAPGRGAWRRSNGFNESDPLILFLGRIQRGKGLEYLVPCLSRLNDKSATLLIAGPDEGGYRAQIERLIDQFGVRTRVRFLGMVRGDQKTSLLQAADVVVAASAHENFGIAVAEALAVGTPVAVSDQVGLADWIVANDAGGVAPLDSDAFAAMLETVLGRSVSGSIARSTLRARAQAVFDWSAVAVRYKAMYSKYANSSNAR